MTNHFQPTNPDQERQLAFEKERKLSAIKRFRKQERRMAVDIPGGYTSGTAAGRPLVADVVKTLAPKLETLVEVESRKYTTRARQAAAVMVAYFGAERLLGILVKKLFDLAGKDSRIKSAEVVSTFANALRNESMRMQYEELDPGITDRCIRYLQRSHGVSYVVKNTLYRSEEKTGILRKELQSNFTNLADIYPGLRFILEVLVEHTSWFEVVTANVGKKKATNFVRLTEEFAQFRNARHAAIEEQLIESWPMLCQPLPWNLEGREGGYLMPVGRYRDLVKAAKGSMEFSPKQLSLINDVLQPTAFRLCPHIAGVQHEMFTAFDDPIGDFIPLMVIPEHHMEMPEFLRERPVDDPERYQWRKETGRLRNQQQDRLRDANRTIRTHVATQALLNEPRLFSPWSLGHNGRAYPLAAGAINLQGCDSERALVRFSEPGPVTPRAKRHLQLHCANVFGITRSHEAKLDWIAQNIDLIRAVAADPRATRDHWKDADDPWQFAAACREVVDCVFEQTRLETDLPVGLDATASGPQILCLLSRDRQTAERVNLIPGLGSKQDIYSTLLTEYLPQEFIRLGRPDLAEREFTRKTGKGQLMTRCYGSKEHSRRQKIWTSEDCTNLSTDDVTLIASAFEAAMKRMMPGALKLYDALARVGKICADRGEPVRWTTPVGNTVEIAPMVHPSRRVKLGFMGHLLLADDTAEPELNLKKVKSSAAPLFVHSLDAALLAEAYHDWDKPLVTVHDCLLTRACDADDALQSILRAYTTVLSDREAILGGLLSSNSIDPDEVKFPNIGTMTDEDMSRIVECEYAFC